MTSTIIHLFVSVFIFKCWSKADIKISKFEMRPPQWNDIGLFFDVGFINTADRVKQPLGYRVRSDKCCLSLPNADNFCNVNKLVGGFFGPLEPGEVQTITLVWPTVTVYNRDGHCKLIVITINSTDGKNQLSHTTSFNTTFNTGNVPTIMKAYLLGRNYTDCNTQDQNPFTDCLPVNCEEKYFGKRNYFNCEKQICENVPECSGTDMIYDYLINECVNPKKILTSEDIEHIRSGECDSNQWTYKRSLSAELGLSPEDLSTYNDDTSSKELDPVRPITFLNGLLHGSLIVLATLGVYLLVCLFIFILIAWVSRRRSSAKRTSWSSSSACNSETYPIYQSNKKY